MNATDRPILDRMVARDHLLDARVNLLAIQDSTFPDTALYAAMEKSLAGVDDALRELSP